ncbi:MAG: hypothetical protein ACP5VE_01220 [Chthonomonadales bacterium]
MATTKALRTATALAMIAGFCAFSGRTAAQLASPRLVETGGAQNPIFGSASERPSYIGKNGEPLSSAKDFVETLRGNGTRGGYLLSHGGVIPESVRVSVNARTLLPNVDYFVDAANGMLAFTDPVSRWSSICVSYTYVEAADAQRTSFAPQGLALNLQGTSLNLVYGISSDKARGLDFTTYGLSMNSRLGSASVLNGLFYVSTPAATNNNLLEDRAHRLLPVTRAATAKDLGTDHLIVQNLNVKSGRANFRVTYQDVGAQFNGFQALQQSNIGRADVLAQLATLQKEKGIQRLGFGGGLSLSRSDGLTMDWSTINDKKGQILQQSLGYTGKALNFSYTSRAVTEGFTRFNDLSENDRVQWAHERGMHRDALALNMGVGKGGSFAFDQMGVGDKSGGLQRQSFAISGKGFSFSLVNRSADTKFGRIADLSDADKTLLALDIHRQFDPNAQAGSVSPVDKQQLALDAGLNRSVLSLTSALGKQGALGFQSFGIDDGKGAITRRSLSLTMKGFTVLNWTDQTISDSFSRLANLSNLERSQFANERGIHRTSLALNLPLSKASMFAFSQLGVSDRTAGFTRQSFTYASKNLAFNLNLASTDKNFSRVQDLAMAPAERNAIEAERGFKRMDFSAHIAAIKGLTFDTYNYDASNAHDRLSRSIFRHNLVWNLGRASVLNFLSEGSSSASAGRVVDGHQHELISLDHTFRGNFKVNLFHDTLATVSGSHNAVTTTTDYLRLETPVLMKRASLLGEIKRAHATNGSFENTTHLNMNYVASKTMSLRYETLRIDRGKDPSANTDTLEMKWAVSKSLNFAGTVSDTHTNNHTDVHSRAFSLSGPLTRDLNFAGTYTQVQQEGVHNVRTVSDFAVSNARPLNVLGLRQVTFTGKYAGISDHSKQQSEVATGAIHGFLGKNELSFEYGGSLDPKGNSAVSRSFTFVSDRNPKLPYHFDLMYKALNFNRSNLQLVRKYNFALRLDKVTEATFTYTSLPQQPNGQMLPTASTVFALHRDLSKTMKFTVDYTSTTDFARRTLLQKLAASVNGKIDKLSAVQVGYGYDVNSQPGSHYAGHTIRVSYDHQVDADHYLSLGTAYTVYEGAQRNGVEADVALKTRF